MASLLYKEEVLPWKSRPCILPGQHNRDNPVGKVVSMGELSPVLIYHVAAWVGEISLVPHQCLRLVGELILGT